MSKASNSEYSIDGRFWINSEKGPFLGRGRVELLKKVKEHGSISKAAASMEMAYKQAWHLIQSMNEKASSPLVEKVIGGKGGGGAILTKEGEKMIKLFEDLESDIQEFLDKKSAKLKI
ncbi:MAG: LysR family transcriptional regulator [Sporocytophaga sp.]|uniref:winged helix-turn-helix domain-containing protein n=1 Tax=Sporocytophaga sp. TaxID=2231183 RepID=UPI001B1A6B6D|nr:LysR family transcriptional regulator [Sporocytophaga sp.]MBO9702754.1 LysR family transcriptional regulator [Sporocytophaga sp.]